MQKFVCIVVKPVAPKPKKVYKKEITWAKLDKKLDKANNARGLKGSTKVRSETSAKRLHHRINRLSTLFERVGCMGLREIGEGADF